MPTNKVHDIPTPTRATRPLYIKKVPLTIWNRIHINAIESQMRLQDYLVTVLAATAPIQPAGVATPIMNPDQEIRCENSLTESENE